MKIVVCLIVVVFMLKCGAPVRDAKPTRVTEGMDSPIVMVDASALFPLKGSIITEEVMSANEGTMITDITDFFSDEVGGDTATTTTLIPAKKNTMVTDITDFLSDEIGEDATITDAEAFMSAKENTMVFAAADVTNLFSDDEGEDTAITDAEAFMSAKEGTMVAADVTNLFSDDEGEDTAITDAPMLVPEQAQETFTITVESLLSPYYLVVGRRVNKKIVRKRIDQGECIVLNKSQFSKLFIDVMLTTEEGKEFSSEVLCGRHITSSSMLSSCIASNYKVREELSSGNEFHKIFELTKMENKNNGDSCHSLSVKQ